MISSKVKLFIVLAIGILIGYGIALTQMDRAIETHIEKTQEEYNSKKKELIERELKLLEKDQ